MRNQKNLWAVELDISQEAGRRDYWVIHSEDDSDGYGHLLVFDTKKEALAEAKGRDHASRVVQFSRVVVAGGE